MMESELHDVNMPHRQEVASWVSQAYQDVSSNVISNSWRHAPYN